MKLTQEEEGGSKDRAEYMRERLEQVMSSQEERKTLSRESSGMQMQSQRRSQKDRFVCESRTAKDLFLLFSRNVTCTEFVRCVCFAAFGSGREIRSDITVS